MELGQYDIPEGYESMTCIHNCGFFIVWASGSPESHYVMEVMNGHLAGHKEIKPSFLDWLRYGRGK